MQIDIIDAGLAKFTDTLALQDRLVEQRRGGQIGDMVIIVEHQVVITSGARRTANKLPIFIWGATR